MDASLYDTRRTPCDNCGESTPEPPFAVPSKPPVVLVLCARCSGLTLNFGRMIQAKLKEAARPGP